jgi:large subunit ribosomal protein L21
VKNGHRQQLTQIQIVSIAGADAPKAKKAAKKETTEEVAEENQLKTSC